MVSKKASQRRLDKSGGWEGNPKKAEKSEEQAGIAKVPRILHVVRERVMDIGKDLV